MADSNSHQIVITLNSVWVQSDLRGYLYELQYRGQRVEEEEAATATKAAHLPGTETEPDEPPHLGDNWQLHRWKLKWSCYAATNSTDTRSSWIWRTSLWNKTLQLGPHMDSGILKTIRIRKRNWKKQPRPVGPNGWAHCKCNSSVLLVTQQVNVTAWSNTRHNVRPKYLSLCYPIF